jgi:hypothetical protein
MLLDYFHNNNNNSTFPAEYVGKKKMEKSNDK